MSNMTIKVDFLAGTDFKDAVIEAKEKVVQFKAAYVCFNFNGVSCSISSRASVDEAYKQYHEAMRFHESERKHIVL